MSHKELSGGAFAEKTAWASGRGDMSWNPSFFMISIDLGPLQHAFSTVLEGSKTSTAGSGSGSSSAWWA